MPPLSTELGAAAFADVQARVRTSVRSTFVRRGLIDKYDAGEMCTWAHDGDFSVDGSVRIEGAHRTGFECVLRYCGRPPFALEHLNPARAQKAAHWLRVPGCLIFVSRCSMPFSWQRISNKCVIYLAVGPSAYRGGKVN